MTTVTAVDPETPIIDTPKDTPLYVDLSEAGGGNTETPITVTGSTGGDTVILGDFSGQVNTGGGSDFVDASGGSSTVVAGAGNDYIISGGGSQPETGFTFASAADDPQGTGNTFLFKPGSGKDVIEGFDLTKDVIKIRNYDGIESVKDVIKHASQSGDNVVIKLGDGNKITLLGVSLKDLKKHPGDHFDVG